MRNAVYAHASPRPRLTSLDRAFWGVLRRRRPRWREVLVVVPTVRFQRLYVWFVLDQDRRRLIHFNVTTSPTARWAIHELREASPWDTALPFLVYDRDSIFSAEVTAAIRNLGSEPMRTAYRSPWQNPFAERKGGRPPSRGPPPPSVRMVQSSLTPGPSAHQRHAMSSEDRQDMQGARR